MEPLIKSDNYEIYKKENSVYKLCFRYTSYSLVNSLIKSRLIAGSSTNESYNIITFKAESVKTLKKYLHDYNKNKGRINLLISDSAKMIRSLVIQLKYLLEKESSTILGYSPEEIIVINDDTFVFVGSELIADFDVDTEHAMISCPFSPKDFFFSPELLIIKELPAYVHFKISYFSLACLIINVITGENEFYSEYLRDKQPTKILDQLNNHPVKETKIYWLLSRCLVEDPKNRSIIFI